MDDNEKFEALTNGADLTEMQGCAVQLHEIHIALVEQGFTVEQATYLVGKMVERALVP